MAASAVLVTLVIGTFGRILISLSLFPLSSKMSAAGLYACGKGVGTVVLPCSTGVAVGSAETVAIGLAACSSDFKTGVSPGIATTLFSVTLFASTMRQASLIWYEA